MTASFEQLSVRARNAAFRRDWQLVATCSRAILERDEASAEGHFLSGLVLKAGGRTDAAVAAFERALALDPGRHDAAVELAHQLVGRRRHGDAAGLVERYRENIANSPLYLNMAGSILATIGLPERAWPLFARAVELQPGVDLFEANLAACGVFVGKIEASKRLYRGLLGRFPGHQRYHYQLARLEKAADGRHVETMQRILATEGRPPKDNVFMYYAIGKELEDLERWDEAFDYFELAGNAVAGVADYDVADDIELVDAIIASSGAGWLADRPARHVGGERVPVFVVGLPRSGTTLVDRILSSHPDVASVGETQYLPMVVRALSAIESDRKMTPAMIRAAAALPIDAIGGAYLEMLGFRLGGERFFVDKLPFNVLYLGFIARAFPDARIVLVRRQPMDACFAMYKQVFTGAYKFSYTQEALGRFYIAYRRLLDHWQQALGQRLVTVDYETLVASPEAETRRLLSETGIGFDPACLRFDANETATATASAVQVREGMHTRSVGRWRRYEQRLAPLRALLESAGVAAL